MRGTAQGRADDSLRPVGFALLMVIAVSSVVAVAGFRAVLIDWSFLIAACAGAAVGTAAVAVAWRFRLLIGESIALSVLAFFIGGVVVAGPLPGPTAINALFDGVVNGWANLLSLSPPVDLTAELRVLPFALAWIGVTVGGELLRRTRAPALPMLGPLIGLVVSVLIADENRSVAVTQGVLLALAALLIGLVTFVQHDSRSQLDLRATGDGIGTDDDSTADRSTSTRSNPRSRRRVAHAALLLGGIAAVAPLLGPRLPFAEAYERFDLRDRNDPPWDPLSLPSPLVQVKSELKNERRDDVVMTVQSDEPVTRFALARLGDFNGVVWTVGSTDGSSAVQEFRPVGQSLPQRPTPVDAPLRTVSATISIGDLRGPWLPAPSGWPVGASFEVPPSSGDSDGDTDGDTDGDEGSDLRMNLTTGTLAVPSGIGPGTTYTIDVDVVERTDDVSLREISIVPLMRTDDDDVLPPQIQNLAADLVEGVDQGWAQVEAISDRFIDDGFYDIADESRPGHSFFRISQFLDDPDRLVGYEEQYAAAAATVARSAQIPARVTVGYLIPEERYDESGEATILAEDISAWIEVDMGARGWIPVDVTPDRSREPVEESAGVTIEDVATPSPPPPPQIPPQLDVLASEEEPEEDEEDEEDDEEDDALSVGLTVGTAVTIGAGLIALLLLGIGFGTILWKQVRRRRRRTVTDPAQSVGFAWREVLDRYQEAGIDVGDRTTPGEVARHLDDIEFVGAQPTELASLVGVVQRAAYHPDEPGPSDGEAAWTYHDDVVSGLYDSVSIPQRLRMRVDPRTLRAPQWRVGRSHQVGRPADEEDAR